MTKSQYMIRHITKDTPIPATNVFCPSSQCSRAASRNIWKRTDFPMRHRGCMNLSGTRLRIFISKRIRIGSKMVTFKRYLFCAIYVSWYLNSCTRLCPLSPKNSTRVYPAGTGHPLSSPLGPRNNSRSYSLLRYTMPPGGRNFWSIQDTDISRRTFIFFDSRTGRSR